MRNYRQKYRQEFRSPEFEQYLRDGLLHRGLTLSDIASEYGVSKQRMHQIARRFGISVSDQRDPIWLLYYHIRHQRKNGPKELIITPKWLKTQLQRKTFKQLAEELGISVNILKEIFKKLGIYPDLPPKIVKVACTFCGRVFNRLVNRTRQGQKFFFCNKICQGKWLARITKGMPRSSRGKYERRKVRCSFCGKEFFRIIRNPKQKLFFCNRYCHGKWLNKIHCLKFK